MLQIEKNNIFLCYLCELQWDRYLLCDGSPDPTIPGEINTYINLWRENTTDRSVDIILNESLLILRVNENNYVVYIGC